MIDAVEIQIPKPDLTLSHKLEGQPGDLRKKGGQQNAASAVPTDGEAGAQIKSTNGKNNTTQDEDADRISVKQKDKNQSPQYNSFRSTEEESGPFLGAVTAGMGMYGQKQKPVERFQQYGI